MDDETGPLMHVLVTGGAGFIGSNFVRYLLNETNYRVISLDSLTYAGDRSNLKGTLEHDRHQFVEGDIRNRDLVMDLLSEADTVVNFAAESHVDRSVDDSEPFISTNVQGTQMLLDAANAVGVDRFLQISTDEVYGQILDGSFTEDDPLEPRNPYAASKASADLLTLSYHTTHDLPALVTRECNNFGPRQHREKLIPKFLTLADAGEELPLYGDGSNVREWLYVQDHCRAVETVLTEGEVGKVYNIGGGEELTNREVTEAILDITGASDDLVEFVEDRPGHDQRYSLNSSKMRSLGWEPQWSFEEGLAKTANYYLE
jgi:dTDP-glucose 4,6-dehydratase